MPKKKTAKKKKRRSTSRKNRNDELWNETEDKGKRGPRTKKTKATVEIILKALRLVGHVELACNYAQIDTATYYNWMKKDPEFSAAAQLAQAECAMRLAQKVETRDTQGPWKLLKNLKPKIYRDKIDAEVTGKDGGAVEIIVKNYVDDVSDDENS